MTFDLLNHIAMRENSYHIIDSDLARGLALVIIGCKQYNNEIPFAMTIKNVDCSMISQEPIRRKK